MKNTLLVILVLLVVGCGNKNVPNNVSEEELDRTWETEIDEFNEKYGSTRIDEADEGGQTILGPFSFSYKAQEFFEKNKKVSAVGRIEDIYTKDGEYHVIIGLMQVQPIVLNLTVDKETLDKFPVDRDFGFYVIAAEVERTVYNKPYQHSEEKWAENASLIIYGRLLGFKKRDIPPPDFSSSPMKNKRISTE